MGGRQAMDLTRLRGGGDEFVSVGKVEMADFHHHRSRNLSSIGKKKRPPAVALPSG
jgi:hypothetical protein